MGVLTGKTAIVGVGETTYYRDAGRTTLSLGVEAIRNAVKDAGLELSDIDGMTSYQAGGDSHGSNEMAQSLGMQLNYSLDIMGGGSSTEALVAHAAGLLAGGYCNNIVIFRSMRGRTGKRMGGQTPSGPVPAVAINTDGEALRIGVTTPAQNFGIAAMRYFKEYGAGTKQLAAVAMTHRYHATLNPRAFFYKKPLTLEDYISARWVSKPFRLFDCCLEMDVACAFVMTRKEMAYDLKHPPIYILGGSARTMSESPAYNPGRLNTAVHHHASNWASRRWMGMSGVTHKDIDTASFYDAFTFTPLIQMEGYGFVDHGEAGFWYEEGHGRLDARMPVNTSGSHLSEGYTHGMSMVIENVRQLRGDVDDYCPVNPNGLREHTYDYETIGACRQVKNASISANLGWAHPGAASAVVLHRG